MKRGTLFVLATILLAGCLSKEQSQQIHLFWLQQYSNLMMKKMSTAMEKMAKDPNFEEFAKKFNMQQLPAAPQPSGNTQPAAQPPVQKPARPQIMEVTLDSDALPGKASHADRVRMKRSLEAVQISNQATLSDIAATFEAVLKKLPHVSGAEENLGLAVRVLLDGTEESFETARKKASIRRDREVLREKLSKNELYSGYEYDFAERFGGKKDFAQIEREMDDLLNSLPFCSQKKENKELACKVLLGSLSQEEASKQAQYLRDLKAQTLTQGLAPELLKSYLGTKSADELMKFFDESLSPYTFWKSDREKHNFALRTLVGELNGTYNRRISQFVLEMLENGSSLDLMTDMLSNIQKKKTSKEELENLLDRYKQARAASKA